jgi:hypothetical protein
MIMMVMMKASLMLLVLMPAKRHVTGKNSRVQQPTHRTHAEL